MLINMNFMIPSAKSTIDFLKLWCLFLNGQKIAACAKHYVGDGGTTEGINENNTVTSMHGLLSIHMPAYYDSIIKGVATVMISYSSWNGIKMHANRDLITGYLKNTLRFRVKPISQIYSTWDFSVCCNKETRINVWIFVNYFRVLSFQIGRVLTE